MMLAANGFTLHCSAETPPEIKELEKENKRLKKKIGEMVQFVCSHGYEVVAMNTHFVGTFQQSYCLQRFD